MVRYFLRAIAGLGLAIIVDQAQADDVPNAILVLESGKVVLCVSAGSTEPVDPHTLLGGTIYNGKLVWGNDSSGISAGYSLQVISDRGDVGVAVPHVADLVLGYSAETHFSPTDAQILKGDLGQIESGLPFLKKTLAAILPAVARRAQELGATKENIRLTGLAYVDIDQDSTFEVMVETSSTPDPAGSEAAQPGQFAGVFLMTLTGAPLAEQIEILGHDDAGTHLKVRLAAAGRNPFVRETPRQWDFLIETTRERRSPDGTRMRVRTVEVRYYAANQLLLRNQMSFRSCLGSDCAN